MFTYVQPNVASHADASRMAHVAPTFSTWLNSPRYTPPAARMVGPTGMPTDWRRVARIAIATTRPRMNTGGATRATYSSGPRLRFVPSVCALRPAIAPIAETTPQTTPADARIDVGAF